MCSIFWRSLALAWCCLLPSADISQARCLTVQEFSAGLAAHVPAARAFALAGPEAAAELA